MQAGMHQKTYVVSILGVQRTITMLAPSISTAISSDANMRCVVLFNKHRPVDKSPVIHFFLKTTDDVSLCSQETLRNEAPALICTGSIFMLGTLQTDGGGC
jgi:hypothetical protein